MKRWLLPCLVLAFAVAGCAGGWRNGPPAGAEATAAPTAAPVAKGAAPAKSAAAAADHTHATADGAIFVWKGEGTSVDVAGEFNDWNTSADPLTKQADGSWSLTKKLDPGRYAYKFVIDGSNWKEDPTAIESVDDGYGGKNSIVVVGGEGAGAAAKPAAAAPAAKVAAKAPAAKGTGNGPQVTPDGVVFTWSGPGNSVNLAGEFNSWSTSADPMTKQADGIWTITKKLDPGRYAYKFVIDGTNWKEDPAATESVDDGYGGKNSVVVVGEGAGAAAPAAAETAVTGTGKPPEVTADGVRFTFAGKATSVNLAGDFNAWSTTADPMTRQADGTWTIVKKLEPGRYNYKYVVNGTTWKYDESNPETSDDGFGGKNSVVVVP